MTKQMSKVNALRYILDETKRDVISEANTVRVCKALLALGITGPDAANVLYRLELANGNVATCPSEKARRAVYNLVALQSVPQ